MADTDNKILIRRLNYNKCSLDNTQSRNPKDSSKRFHHTQNSFNRMETLNHKLAFLTTSKKKIFHKDLSSFKITENDDMFQHFASERYKMNSNLTTRIEGSYYEPSYHKHLDIPVETEIRQTFKFRLPTIIQ